MCLQARLQQAETSAHRPQLLLNTHKSLVFDNACQHYFAECFFMCLCGSLVYHVQPQLVLQNAVSMS